MTAIPRDRCERCIALLDENVFRADRDRVCEVCAQRAENRGETVTRVCAVCLGEPLPPTPGPDGRPILGACAACTPLPPGVQDLLEADGA